MTCNVFYADLEAKSLAFTREPGGLLLRLIDDFLFITLSRDNAVRFLDVMHKGLPEYGAQVQLEKSLVNFETRISGELITRVLGSDSGFPYCGVSICEKTLDIRRENPRKVETKIADSISMDCAATIGKAMQRRVVK